MKISNSTPNYINQSYTNKANSLAAPNQKSLKSAEEAVSGKFSDSINLSSRTKDLQKISSALETEPADRQKLVSDIKLQVETNQYNINVEAVAEKMAGTLMDKIV